MGYISFNLNFITQKIDIDCKGSTKRENIDCKGRVVISNGVKCGSHTNTIVQLQRRVKEENDLERDVGWCF